MKSIFTIAFLALASTSTALASATCPAGTSTVLSCDSTPRKGDHEVAIGIFDSIAICGKNAKAFMVTEKAGQSDVTEVSVTSRAGGVSYVADAGGTKFSLNLATGIYPSKSQAAKLSIAFSGANVPAASSTYTCQR